MYKYVSIKYSYYYLHLYWSYSVVFVPCLHLFTLWKTDKFYFM